MTLNSSCKNVKKTVNKTTTMDYSSFDMNLGDSLCTIFYSRGKDPSLKQNQTKNMAFSRLVPAQVWMTIFSSCKGLKTLRII